MKWLAIFLVAFAILPAACKPPASQVATPRPALIPPEEPNLRGLHAFIEKAIARANKRASALNGKTFIEHCSFDRTIYFVPRPVPPKPEPARVEVIDGETVIVVPPRKPLPPIVIPDVPLSERPEPPPKDAVAKRWTDRYALAQQFTYKYSLVSVGPMMYGQESPESKVRIKVVANRRTAVAADEKPIPQPPEGMRVWRPIGSRFFFSGSAGDGSRELRDIKMPHRAGTKIKGPLAKKAVRKMLETPEEVLEKTVNLKASYWPKGRFWTITRILSADLPSPVNLWSKSASRGGRAVRSQLTTRPAD